MLNLTDTQTVSMVRHRLSAGIYSQHSEQAALIRYIDKLEDALIADRPVNAVASSKVIAANMDERVELRRMTQILDA